jgi:hypothetical protein
MVIGSIYHAGGPPCAPDYRIACEALTPYFMPI